MNNTTEQGTMADTPTFSSRTTIGNITFAPNTTFRIPQEFPHAYHGITMEQPESKDEPGYEIAVREYAIFDSVGCRAATLNYNDEGSWSVEIETIQDVESFKALSDAIIKAMNTRI